MGNGIFCPLVGIYLKIDSRKENFRDQDICLFAFKEINLMASIISEEGNLKLEINSERLRLKNMF